MKKRKNTELIKWQEKCKDGTGCCVLCGSQEFLSVDHIVPVFLLNEFDINKEEVLYNWSHNFQILCNQCHKQKANHLDLKNHITYRILIDLLVTHRNKYTVQLQDTNQKE